MAGIAMGEFEQRILSVCSGLAFVKNVFVFASTESSNLWRVTLADNSFVDVYYSEITGKISFAHIKDEQRVFGADNAGNWHWRPHENPASHVPSKSEISFEEFMAKLEASIK
ncbi:MAG: hypothetical protein HYZ21_10140 [Chloroflexi bacterium]|nr:hypothetical protein [Chloroflexota bacterium]